MEDNIKVIYDAGEDILLVLGDNAIEINRKEAEQLFVDLGNALKDQDIMRMEKLKNPDKT